MIAFTIVKEPGKDIEIGNMKKYDLSYLRDLYTNKDYEKILELKNENDSYAVFYVGRVYKDLQEFDNAIAFLNKYIEEAEGLCDATNENPENEFLLSAYFNLGELYYSKKDFAKAEECFLRCMDLSNNAHVKAFQHIIGLNPEIAKERISLFLRRTNKLSDKYLTWVPPGHYYSPIPEIEDIRKREDRVFNNNIAEIDGIYLNEAEQLKLFEELKGFYPDQPFREEKQEDIRYYFRNGYYLHTDAIILYSMIRLLKPRRIIEVGQAFLLLQFWIQMRGFLATGLNVYLLSHIRKDFCPYSKKMI